MFFREMGRILVRAYFKIFNRIEVIGVENIPMRSAVLLCSNHFSNFDPFLLGVSSPRNMYYMAKAELFRIPVLRSLLRGLLAFPVNRGVGDRKAIQNCLELLREGHALCIFPEGHRSRDGKLQKGLSGAGFFAKKSKSIVIPCAITGSYKWFRQIKVIFGSPIHFSDLRNQKSASNREATERIMTGIRALVTKYEINSEKSNA